MKLPFSIVVSLSRIPWGIFLRRPESPEICCISYWWSAENSFGYGYNSPSVISVCFMKHREVINTDGDHIRIYPGKQPWSEWGSATDRDGKCRSPDEEFRPRVTIPVTSVTKSCQSLGFATFYAIYGSWKCYNSDNRLLCFKLVRR